MKTILIGAVAIALAAGVAQAQTSGSPSGVPPVGRGADGGAGSMTVNRYGSGAGVAGPATRPVATPEESEKMNAAGVPSTPNGAPPEQPARAAATPETPAAK